MIDESFKTGGSIGVFREYDQVIGPVDDVEDEKEQREDGARHQVNEASTVRPA